MERIFRWFDKNKNRETPFVLAVKFLYSVTNDWLVMTTNTLTPIFLSILYEDEKKNKFMVLIIIYILFLWWYSIVNIYKNRRNKKEKNVKMINEDINVAMTTLDNYINNEYEENGVFEFASDLVSASIYDSIGQIIECEIRVSVIQQFIDNSKKNCVMVSRRSKKRQKSRKQQKIVKYKRHKDYYYNKILLDNSEGMIIFNEEQIEKNFYYQNEDRKSHIRQFIAIPDKNSSDEIVFILQLDAMKSDAFGKNREDINDFYDNYIYPYICFLRHAYNIEKNLKKRKVVDNE